MALLGARVTTLPSCSSMSCPCAVAVAWSDCSRINMPGAASSSRPAATAEAASASTRARDQKIADGSIRACGGPTSRAGTRLPVPVLGRRSPGREHRTAAATRPARKYARSRPRQHRCPGWRPASPGNAVAVRGRRDRPAGRRTIRTPRATLSCSPIAARLPSQLPLRSRVRQTARRTRGGDNGCPLLTRRRDGFLQNFSGADPAQLLLAMLETVDDQPMGERD